MIRWKFTYDKDEEQDWLNEYARQGWAMTKFWLGVVTFVPALSHQLSDLPPLHPH